MEDARRFAVENLLEDLFPALDGLTQALAAYKDESEEGNALLTGLRRTARALEAALLRHGVEKIGESAVPYDPEVHQAVSVEGDGESEEVAEVYTEGYRMHGKVLKPAMVRVLRKSKEA
jgi:molecular chaperone GrpE